MKRLFLYITVFLLAVSCGGGTDDGPVPPQPTPPPVQPVDPGPDDPKDSENPDDPNDPKDPDDPQDPDDPPEDPKPTPGLNSGLDPWTDDGEDYGGTAS